MHGNACHGSHEYIERRFVMDLSKLNKINPEINWHGKKFKISLAGLFGAAIMIALNPAAAATILPASWVPAVTKVAPYLLVGGLGGGILFNMDPNKGTVGESAPGVNPTSQITPEMVQEIVSSLLAASKSNTKSQALPSAIVISDEAKP
jgi:hypothetical protein